MFNGRSEWLFYTLTNDSGNHSSTLNGLPTSLTYSQLSCDNDYDILSKLGGSFSKVSTQDASGITVDGKYSFPGSDDALQGKNYPFPTVINEDKFNVHYGEWPFYGAYFSSGITTFDLFDELDIENNAKFAYKDIVLNKNGSDLSDVQFASSSTDVATIEKQDGKDYRIDENGNCVVRLKVLKTGSTTLTATWVETVVNNGKTENVTNTATTSVNITAELNMTADKIEFTLGNVENDSTRVYVKSKNGKEYTDSIANGKGGNMFTYTVQEVDDSPLAFVENSGNKFNITGFGQNATIQVKAFYIYNQDFYEGNLTLYVYRPGTLGLSDGSDYNEANLFGETVNDDATIGFEANYTTSAKPTSDKTYFLYSINDTNDILSTVKPENITLNDIEGNAVDSDKYKIILDSSQSNVNEYGYKSLGFNIIYRGDSALIGASLLAQIKDVNNNEYTLAIGELIIEPTPYQLTLDGNGGTFSGDENIITLDITSNKKFGDLDKPTRKGYTFDSIVYVDGLLVGLVPPFNS